MAQKERERDNDDFVGGGGAIKSWLQKMGEREVLTDSVGALHFTGGLWLRDSGFNSICHFWEVK